MIFTDSNGLCVKWPSSELDLGKLLAASTTGRVKLKPASGMISHRELTQAGFDVRIFERDSVPG